MFDRNTYSYPAYYVTYIISSPTGLLHKFARGFVFDLMLGEIVLLSPYKPSELIKRLRLLVFPIISYGM